MQRPYARVSRAHWMWYNIHIYGIWMKQSIFTTAFVEMSNDNIDEKDLQSLFTLLQKFVCLLYCSEKDFLVDDARRNLRSTAGRTLMICLRLVMLCISIFFEHVYRAFISGASFPKQFTMLKYWLNGVGDCLTMYLWYTCVCYKRHYFKGHERAFKMWL